MLGKQATGQGRSGLEWGATWTAVPLAGLISPHPPSGFPGSPYHSLEGLARGKWAEGRLVSLCFSLVAGRSNR